MEGNEPIYARGTVRLARFKKTFPSDLAATVFDKEAESYAPLILTCGRPLLCSEILPERADLALDEKGHVLSQGEFEQNYKAYLDAFSYPDGTDTNFEPVPNVIHFIKETPDPYGESRGMVEIGWDAQVGKEFNPSQKFGPNGETEEEYKKEQAKQSGDVADALQKLAQNQELLTQFLMNQKGETPIPVEVPQQEAESEVGIHLEDAVAATSENEYERAPCGKPVRKGYVKQHMRHCKSEGCGDDSVNSGDEAA